MDEAPDAMLELMTRRIAERFDPEKVILFGSRARGDARPDSDYDLLVVFSACLDKRQSAISLGKALSDLLASKDILVATSAEIDSDRPSAIVRSALRDGRTVYERTPRMAGSR